MQSRLLGIVFCAALAATGLAFAADCRVLAQFCGECKSAKYDLEMGQELRLNIEGDKHAHPAVFLGRLVTVDGSRTGYMFYDKKMNAVRSFNPGDIEIIKKPGGRPLDPDDPEDAFPIVRSLNQQGPTCGAFSLYNCMRTLKMRGLEGKGTLAQYLADETMRTGFLTSIIASTYIGSHPGYVDYFKAMATAHGYTPMTAYAGDYASEGAFKSAVLHSLEHDGSAVLLSFAVEKPMSLTPYRILDEKDVESMRALWIPRSFNDSSSDPLTSRHLVLALGVVEINDKEYMLISVPN